MNICVSGWISRSTAPHLAAAVVTLSASINTASAAPAAASVQTQAESTSQSSGDDQLAEVTVTARRRDESLERVPISIVAFGPKQLEQRTITSQADLQSAVPGLTIRSTSTSTFLGYSIRGQTLDAFSSSSPGVLPYFNEVNANTGGVAQIYDMGSLQVLKGPQGTLFGRNTTGGAVLFNSITPGDVFGGYFKQRLGNYNLRESVGAVDLPIVSDRVLLRVAGDTKRRDGYITNLYDGAKLGEIAQDSVRTTLLVRPVAGLENTTVFQYNESRGNNATGGIYSLYAPGGVVTSIQAPGGYRASPGVLNTTVYNFYTPAIGAQTWANYIAAHPGVDPLGVAHYVGEQAANGPYQVDENDPNFHFGKDRVLTNTTKYAVDGLGQLKNVFGYVSSSTRDGYDQDGTPYGILTFVTPNGTGFDLDRRQLSEELQWSGNAWRDQINYIVGAYGASEKIETYSKFAAFDLLPLAPAGLAESHFQSTDKQWAAYAQSGYKLAELTGIDGLTLNGGVRWTHDEFQLHQLPFGAHYGADDESTSASKPSWSVGLDYQLDENLLLYVAQRGSWRTGGITGYGPPVLATIAAGGNVFLPETTRDVEVGAKFRGDLWGVPVTLNADVYDQRIKNVQRVVYGVIDGGLSALTANIPEAEISGFEVDAAASLTSWLQVGFNVADTHARFTNGHVDYTAVNVTVDYGPYADTPQWSGTTYAQVHADFAHIGEAVLRADVYAQSDFYFSNAAATLTPGTRIPGYSLTNLRFELNHINDSSLSLSLFARNLLDRTYYTGGLATGISLGLNTVNVGEPRMFGAELQYKF